MVKMDTSGFISAITAEDLIIAAHGPIYNGPGAQRLEHPFVLRKLEGHQKEAIERAKKYAMEQSIKTVLIKQTQSQQNLQINAAKRNQTLTLLNRVYIGSIAYDIKEEMIKQSFLPFGPVKSVSMSWDPATQKHKGFAFVEYEYPEAAQLAIEQMNSSNFGGRLLKVGRPSNLPDAAPFVQELIEEYKLQKRIYVAGIHLNLTETDVFLVFEAFGTILMCRLAQDPLRPQFHRGFGYVEFDTEQSANDAVLSMNRFDLGGQLLRVTKAISPPDGILTNTVAHLPPAAAVAAASVTARLLSMEAEQLPSSRPSVSLVSELKSFSSPQHNSVQSPPPVLFHRSKSPSPNAYKHIKDELPPSTPNSVSMPKVISSSEPVVESTPPFDADEHPRLGNWEHRLQEADESAKIDANRSNWAAVSMEEEQQSEPVFVRSNDSRFFSIPSPSSIPLPPPPNST